MSCRVQAIKPPCAYVVEGVEQIWFLDFDDFRGYRFLDDGLYDSCYVTEILQVGSFVEIDAPDLVAKYTSTGAYTHRLETFVGALTGETLSNLNLARKRPQIVLFKTNSQQWFVFGSDAGAVVSYTNQTSDGLGSQVIATANSVYPLFEYVGAVDVPECLPLAIVGAFADDDAAISGGVTETDLYELTAGNIWSLPMGVVKMVDGADTPVTFEGCTDLTVYEAYPDDDAAGAGLVPLNAVYRLSVDNIWAMPTNVLKVRKTGATGAATLPDEIYELSADNIWALPEGTIKTV